MNKKNKTILRIIIGVAIIVYFLLTTNFKDDVKKSSASVAKVIEEEKTTTKKVIKNNDSNLKVYFIDVGQADSILIKNNNHYMLIDAGNNNDGNKLVTYFKELGIEKFDYVVGTHPHEDHIGGIDDIIKNFDVENYMMPDKLSTSKTFEDVLDALESKNMLYTVPKKGDNFNIEDLSFKVIHSGNDKDSINDSSIVLKMTYLNTSFLFTGDITSNIEKQILNDDINCDVLKVAHHGSDYSSKDNFLDKANPLYAIISVGKNNTYKHPSNSTINNLNNRKVKLYRTDLDGTVILTSDGNDINIETINTDTNG